MSFIPCFLCGQKLEKRTTKSKGKPYFHCDPCGIQLFIRKKPGIERLEQFFRNADKAAIPYKQHAQHFHEMQAILKEIDDVKGEIDNIGMSFIFSDEKLRVRDALKTRLEHLFCELEQLAKGNDVLATT